MLKVVQFFGNEEENYRKNFILLSICKVSEDFIYLFIFKNEVAVLRVQLVTYITLSQQNLSSKLLKIYKNVMSFVGLNKNQLKLAT